MHANDVSGGAKTTGRLRGSRFVWALVVSAGCAGAEAEPAPRPTPTPPAHGVSKDPDATPEVCLGVADKGIWSDLDDKVQVALPKVEAARVSARIDRDKKLLIVAIDGFPRKAYPLTGTVKLVVGPHALALRPGDRDELAPLLAKERITEGSTPAKIDRDKDGIPDP